jgi:diguanylate cyclase (GGDEF)-like protein/PAS domain S-box-containing protein
VDSVRVLLLEDDDADAELVSRALRKSELAFEVFRAKSQAEFLSHLADVRPALIISDYSIPGFDGLAALGLARAGAPEVPFIFVSGTIGEERAIEALKRGAADYVLKGNLQRLVPAVQRALRDADAASARRRAEAALIESEERYERLVELSPDGILLVARGTITFANSAALKIYQAQRPEQLVGRRYFDLVHAESLGEVTVRLRSPAPHEFERHLLEQKHVRLDGSVVYVELASASISLRGEECTLIVTRDITERKRYEAQLAHQATHDGLTDLPNRALLGDRLRQATASAQRSGRKVALVFIDLDNFKFVNDSLGHDAGDQVLKDIAARLMDTVRDADTVARLGGDEFVLLFADIADPKVVTHTMERVLTAVSRPIQAAGQEISLTCSAGISVFPLDAQDADLALRNADTAMYRAKEKGRNTFEYFTADMNVGGMEHLVLSAGLRRALDRQEFCLHFQPQIDVRSGAVVGAEALIRWNHPQKGMIAPGKFIALAENTGLIVPIGQWALRAACDATRRLHAVGPPSFGVSVNLSARQFRQADLALYIEEALKSTGLPPQCLELELTESMVAQDVGFAAQTMRALKALGIRLAIDDFGTGYSSLHYLKRFPVDRLKIDRSFVSGITANGDDAAICRTIIALARNLGLRVTAEGVETLEQLDFLRDHGCDEVQGFMVAYPVAEEDLRRMLARN